MIAPLAALLRLHELHVEEVDFGQRKAEVSRLQQSMSDALTERYTKTLRRYGKTAVASLERGICMGCYMRQPSTCIEVEEEIYECQNCSRLLYDPDIAFEYSVG